MQTFNKVKCRRLMSQRENVVWCGQIILFYKETGVVVANGDVRISIKSWELAVNAHEQYKIA